MGYIGAGISRFNTADELTVTGDAEFNGNANFGDSDKVSFSSGKLEMYHDGTNAYIDETYANGTFLIRGNNISLQKYTGETMIQCVSDGKVELNFNNVPKLETTSSGVDITSTATATTFQSNAGGTFTTASGNDLNIVYPDSRSLFIKEGSTTHVTVDNVGNVGIGTSSVDNKLHLENAGTLYLQIENTSTANKFYVGNSGGSAILESTGAYSMNFKTNGSEAFRVDSSQNVLVGTTATVTDVTMASGAVGIDLRGSSDVIIASRDGGHAFVANRQTSDGQLMLFKRAGATVGKISALSSRMGIGTNDVGFFFDGNNDAITPFNPSTNATVDNTFDLGSGGKRYTDIYATNSTIQTSDQNEKQQIASLTDAEITAAKAISKLFKTFKWNDSVTEKGDNARTHTGVIAQQVETAMTDAGLDAGDYAFFISTDWYVDADGEEVEADAVGAIAKNRKGIRYPELLSFIGAATEQRLSNIESRLAALEAN